MGDDEIYVIWNSVEHPDIRGHKELVCVAATQDDAWNVVQTLILADDREPGLRPNYWSQCVPLITKENCVALLLA